MSTALQWFKSTYSGDEGGECLEVAYTWRKSRRSGSEGGECVEVATCPHAVHVRDSKTPGGPTFQVGGAAWAAFVSGTV
ncbi:DUF397 domain-containing protein [Streptomyces sp. NL15-2K]|uniref:DUF397 domain-containing protein n=1 Tax=Streptomyces sp. NL15-2K TaxID=376149 RepID=UPI000F5681EC|nr:MULTISPECIES: DUF397 domain-containing protein [Actinomycetes]WKX11538.1 DUF397 domain-containing protein [Kutzneria buriramensis]GCB48025.1 hypothetical protein SNL152K_5348 [Streptomyces sp. NL15-2K]